MLDISEIRKSINSIDDQILALLSERTKLYKDVAQFKFNNGKNITDNSRENAHLHDLMLKAEKLSVNPELVSNIYDKIFEDSRAHQNSYIKSLITENKTYSNHLTIAFLGEEGTYSYLASYKLPKYQGLRVNTLKLSLEEWEKINPFTSLKTVPWCKEGFYYDAHEKPGKHPYYFAGLYYIQEPSAMSPGAYLPIEPGDRVLDMCAAPGGISTQLAASMKQEGVIVSNDISASRVKALLKNLENFGNRNGIVTSETSEKLASKWPGYFDKILIDAPCSGEGMCRKNESATKSWEAYGVQHCANLQRTILEDAVTLLKSDGMILYSTCTFSPEENEGMIDEFLK